MPAITPGTPLHSLLHILVSATSKVFSQALGAPWSVEIDTTEGTSSVETSAVHFQLSMSGGLQGQASIAFKNSDALLLAQTFLAEPIDPSAELNQDRTEALQELLRQTMGLAATSLKSHFGEVKLEIGGTEPPTWQGIYVGLLASAASTDKLPLGLWLSPELLASISSARIEAPQPIAAPGTEPSARALDPNFDLLLGVNLNLTLRFGQRVLPLREILDLTSGSVIELDREVQEPADLLLGDKLIARGEVVIVDGNYGIRITEVADARQRIGTL
jgi:flagellar motor switch protein FliN/FliY